MTKMYACGHKERERERETKARYEWYTNCNSKRYRGESAARQEEKRGVRKEGRVDDT